MFGFYEPDDLETVCFYRGKSFYLVSYPVDEMTSEDWAAEAANNPGTTRIETLEKKVLWREETAHVDH